MDYFITLYQSYLWKSFYRRFMKSVLYYVRQFSSPYSVPILWAKRQFFRKRPFTFLNSTMNSTKKNLILSICTTNIYQKDRLILRILTHAQNGSLSQFQGPCTFDLNKVPLIWSVAFLTISFMIRLNGFLKTFCTHSKVWNLKIPHVCFFQNNFIRFL